MKKIRLPLGRRSYSIVIGSRILSRAGSLIAPLKAGTDSVIITNARLKRLYGATLARSLERAGITARFELVPDSEKAKSFPVAQRTLERIAARDRLRKTFIIALGGGVVGDLAGFIAAVYKRGIPFVQIPTTLLAQVDSAIGGKVAVDLPVAKNLAGAFYQPRIVISDTSLLGTLPRRQIASGLAEIIKYGVIKEPALFRHIERHARGMLAGDPAPLAHAVWRSSAIKAAVVARDELDTKGVRAALNYGHTIGHAIEAAAGYGSRYTHGEAVAAGMVVAADIASELGMLDRRARDRIESLVTRCGLPAGIRGVRPAAIAGAYLHDKKFVNRKNRFVLPTAIGKVRIVEGVPERVIARAIAGRTGRAKGASS